MRLTFTVTVQPAQTIARDVVAKEGDHDGSVILLRSCVVAVRCESNCRPFWRIGKIDNKKYEPDLYVHLNNSTIRAFLNILFATDRHPSIPETCTVGFDAYRRCVQTHQTSLPY